MFAGALRVGGLCGAPRSVILISSPSCTILCQELFTQRGLLDPFEEFAQKLVEVLLTFTPRSEELPKSWEIFQTNPHAVHAKRLSKLLRSLPQLVPHGFLELKQGPKHGLKGGVLIAVILGIAQPDSHEPPNDHFLLDWPYDPFAKLAAMGFSLTVWGLRRPSRRLHTDEADSI